MSEASETARAELVAAEILSTADPAGWLRLEPTRYDLMASLIALGYLRGVGDAMDAHLETLGRITGSKDAERDRHEAKAALLDSPDIISGANIEPPA